MPHYYYYSNITFKVTGQRDQGHTTDTMTTDKLSYAQRHILVYTRDKNIFSTCNLQSTQNRNSYT